MGTVRAELAFPLENLGLGAAAVARGVEEAALALGIAPLLDRSTHALSGGELQRVALGAALAGRPRLALLDEPTSQLDPVAGDELLGVLRRLNEEWGTAVILAEHRLERCLSAADRVVALRDGAIACDADPRGFLDWASEHAPELQTPGARLFSLAGRRPLPVSVKDARRTLALEARAVRRGRAAGRRRGGRAGRGRAAGAAPAPAPPPARRAGARVRIRLARAQGRRGRAARRRPRRRARRAGRADGAQRRGQVDAAAARGGAQRPDAREGDPRRAGRAAAAEPGRLHAARPRRRRAARRARSPAPASRGSRTAIRATSPAASASGSRSRSSCTASGPRSSAWTSRRAGWIAATRSR